MSVLSLSVIVKLKS